ncbi:MAG: thioredoxin-disulfide reductase [Kiritimatiellae bacterium]|jgi:thioredoxin reductase (NADPH)|nr:thioredoxin-disulfide reductase [Kiritimatiellia bacterium]HPC18973.1 thioredoxin-disulfide reductase [Kiritimatiellia bacterium]HQQ61507.1 thioredoxin-disulfide reductase [Kiritimatiellia bacterium]
MKTLVVIGSGPAGLTAAIYAARAGLEPLVLEGPNPGGPLITTPLIENFPGFPDGIPGFELMEIMRKQAERFGARFRGANVRKLVPRPGGADLQLEDGTTLPADVVIIATGAHHRQLNLPGEQELSGRGISYCATCDGAFHRGQPIAVVGGGDTAMEEALFLTRFASKVTVIHRRDVFRASKIMANRVLEHPKIEVRWNSVITGLLDPAQGRLTALKLRDVKTGADSLFEVGALFVAIGLVPATKPFEDVLECDANGYLLTNGVSTKLCCVFVAGDVADSRYRQAVTAAGSGCAAAIEARHYLESLGA